MSAPAGLAAPEARQGRSERSAARTLEAWRTWPAVIRTKAFPASGAVFASTLCLWLVAIAFWLSTHPFLGITGDANLYIGRALADLDPAGVGRDMAFVYDGQSRFSLFPVALDRLVAAFGTGLAVRAAAIAAIVMWISALAVLARQYLDWRAASLVVLSVALLPASYGATNTLYYSEALAVPRPFAEAFVLLALAVFVTGRLWVPVLLLVCASLLHPIMALAGWAAIGLVLCVEDWRWRVIAAIAAGAMLAAAYSGLPLFDRLTVVMNPDLKAFALYRSPHLFPTAWGFGVLGRIAAQMTTILIAASFFGGRRRLVLFATIIVGIAGIVLQSVFGDVLSLLLVIQAQLWRMAWLMAAMGAGMLGVAAVKLWRQGPRAHVALALLATAWLICEQPVPCLVLCAGALALQFGTRIISSPISWKVARMVWAAAMAFAAVIVMRYLVGYRGLVSHLPAEIYFPGEYIWAERYLAFFIIGACLAAVSLQKPSRLLLAGEMAAAALALFVAVRFWDGRAPFQTLLDQGRHPAALEALIAPRPGEVLWIDGMPEAWLLTGRPQWASRQQGLGTIFSSALALKWRARMQFLMQQGLADRGALIATFAPPAQEFARITSGGVHALCTRADAPAWIIARLVDGQTIPAELKAQYWRPPVPNFELSEEPDTFLWHRIAAYAVLPCAGAQS